MPTMPLSQMVHFQQEWHEILRVIFADQIVG